MEAFEFKLVAHEKVLLEQEVDMVVIPGIEGQMGVLKHHAPMITTLRSGIVSVYQENEIQLKIFVDGGVAEITPERCTALVTEGIPIESLDHTALEMEIKNLLEDVADYQNIEAQQKAEQNLDIAQRKLIELILHKEQML